MARRSPYNERSIDDAVARAHYSSRMKLHKGKNKALFDLNKNLYNLHKEKK